MLRWETVAQVKGTWQFAILYPEGGERVDDPLACRTV